MISASIPLPKGRQSQLSCFLHAYKLTNGTTDGRTADGRRKLQNINYQTGRVCSRPYRLIENAVKIPLKVLAVVEFLDLNNEVVHSRSLWTFFPVSIMNTINLVCESDGTGFADLLLNTPFNTLCE